MSRNHASQSFRVADLLKQITATDDDDRFNLHGIYTTEDDTIFDSVYEKEFASLALWAEFNVEMEMQEEEDEAGYGSLED